MVQSVDLSCFSDRHFWHAGYDKAEYRGRFRLLRDKLRATIFEHERRSTELLAPFQGPNKSNLSRATLLKQLPRNWELLPNFGRLKLIFRQNPLEIYELRLATGNMRAADWQENEASLVISHIKVKIEHNHVIGSNTPIVLLSAHAVGRAFQRSTDRSDSSIIRLISAILPVYGTTITQKDFAIPAGNGAWIGRSIDVDCENMQTKVLAVRTFFD